MTVSKLSVHHRDCWDSQFTDLGGQWVPTLSYNVSVLIALNTPDLSNQLFNNPLLRFRVCVQAEPSGPGFGNNSI